MGERGSNALNAPHACEYVNMCVGGESEREGEVKERRWSRRMMLKRKMKRGETSFSRFTCRSLSAHARLLSTSFFLFSNIFYPPFQWLFFLFPPNACLHLPISRSLVLFVPIPEILLFVGFRLNKGRFRCKFFVQTAHLSHYGYY